MRQTSRDYSLLNTAFGYQPNHDEGEVKPGFGFGTDYGGGLGLKRIYKLWYVQNHKKMISKADEGRYLSDEHIALFLKDHPLIAEEENDNSEGDEPNDERKLPQELSLPQQIAVFKDAIGKDPELASLYFSLSKTNESSAPIEYTDFYINDFLDFMELRASRAVQTVYGDQHDVMMNAESIKRIFDGSVNIGDNLKRFIHIKVREKLKLDRGDTNLRVTMHKRRVRENILDIPQTSLPHISLVADTLWQGRMGKNLSTTEVSELTGVSTSTLHGIELGLCLPTGYALKRLLALYGKPELLHDRSFMAGIIKIDRMQNPVGYGLMLARFAHGSSTRQVEKALEFSARTIKRYERNQNLPPEDVLLKLLSHYGREDFYEDPVFMAPYMQMSRSDFPVAYQLKLARLKKGWTASQVDEMVGIKVGTIHDFESGASLPSALNLHRILAAYGRKDLFDDTPFMEIVTGIDRNQSPLAYELQVERYKRGWTPERLAAASGVKKDLIYQLESGNTSCTYDDLSALLMPLGKAALLEDQNFMGKVKIVQKEQDQTNFSLAHQLKLTRIRKGLLTTDIAISSGLSPLMVIEIETEKAHRFSPAKLNQVLTAYGRTDLYQNTAVMADALGINPDKQIFSFELRLRRFLKIWKAKDLARATKANVSAIIKWETGARLHLAAHYLGALSQALEWRIGDAAKLLCKQLQEDPKGDASKPARAQTVTDALKVIRPHLEVMPTIPGPTI